MHTTDEIGPGAGRSSHWLAVCELGLFGLVFVADWYHLVPISKTPFLFLLGWISLSVRKVGWPGVGLVRYGSLDGHRGLGPVVRHALGSISALRHGSSADGDSRDQRPDLSSFENVQGNAQMALQWLAIVWVLAAFGEELVYRGYLMNRIADLGQPNAERLDRQYADRQRCLRNRSHSTRAPRVSIEEGIAGVVAGISSILRTGRNLCVPILARWSARHDRHCPALLRNLSGRLTTDAGPGFVFFSVPRPGIRIARFAVRTLERGV